MSPRLDDRPVVSDMLLGLIGAVVSGLVVGIMVGISFAWLSTGGN